MTRVEQIVRKRGRPSKAEAQARQDELIDEALRLFMEDGYRATTMEGVAASVGASKSTIYRHYGSKANLLLAAAERSVPSVAKLLARVPADAGRDVADVLRDYAVMLQRVHFDPRLRALWASLAEAQAELGDVLNDDGIKQARAMGPLVDYLKSIAADGRARIDDPVTAACYFSEMVNGGLAQFMRGIPTPEQKAQWVERALIFFLRAIAVR